MEYFYLCYLQYIEFPFNILTYFLNKELLPFMSESQYQPRNCAFHPKQLIFNFCKNPQCLLPLCPSCIKVHSEQHKVQKTYGQFQNIHKVVNDLDTFFNDTSKQLKCCTEQIKENLHDRSVEQEDIKKKIYQARVKMVTLVQRFFNDFEKQVSKSVANYNDSMKENYGKVEDHIEKLQTQLQAKTTYLGNEKVLRTIIGFYAKNQQSQLKTELDNIKTRIQELNQQRVEVVCNTGSTQTVIDELGNYIHLSFINWEQEVKYQTEMVKTGFSHHNSTGNSFITPK